MLEHRSQRRISFHESITSLSDYTEEERMRIANSIRNKGGEHSPNLSPEELKYIALEKALSFDDQPFSRPPKKRYRH